MQLSKMVLTGWKRFLNRATFIPQRYVLGIMGLLGHANSSGMRVTLSMTISQMVMHVASSSQQITGEVCPDPNNVTKSTVTVNHSTLPQHRDYQLYNWSESTQGLILSSFFYGYILAALPSGFLAEKFGGKWVAFGGLLLTSICTICIPWVLQVGGATGLVIVRVAQGIGEATVTPSLFVMMSRWIPPTERSMFAALTFGGAQVGNIFGPYFSGLILGAGTHWSYVYYVFGMIGAAWCLSWALLCYNNPSVHPFISEAEQNTLNKTVVSSTLRKKLDPVPFQAILTSAPLWVLVIAFVGHAFGHVLMITMLPKYFLDVLKFNIKETGLMSALPFIAMFVSSFVFGALSDFAVKRNWHSVRMGRKIYVSFSSGIAGIFMMLASYSGCDRVKAVAYLILSTTMMGAFYCSTKVNSVDLAPNYAGTCSGLAVGMASLTGIIAPAMVGAMTPDQTIAQWRVAFWVMFAILVASNIVFLIWGEAEQQWWDDVEQFGYPESWKGGPFKVRPASEKMNAVAVPEK